MMHSASSWIRHLQLQQHIEGGWYSEVYRSALRVSNPQLAVAGQDDRSAATHIYFLLQQGEFSAFHRIKADEIWHFYSGSPVIVSEIRATGHIIHHLLGNDPSKGESLCCVIEAGSWFGSRVDGDGEYGLVGCTVAPGFEFADLEMADRDELATAYPQHREIIHALTR